MKSNKPKILVFIDWYVPGFLSGGPVRSVSNLIEHLSADADFFVVTRNTDYGLDIPYTDIESDSWVQTNSSCFIYYISKENLNGKTIRHLLNTIDADVIHINGVYSWFFSVLPLYFSRFGRRKVIVSVRGMLAPSAIKIKAVKKKSFLMLVKKLGWYKKVVFHATSQGEAEDIRKVAGKKAKISIAPNLAPPWKKPEPHPPLKSDILKLVSISRIAEEKNLLFFLTLLQGWTGKKILLDLYGPVYSEAYWKKCLEVIKSLNKKVEVKYHGPLKREDITAVLQNADFLVLPSRGENFGHIVVEAWAAGTPVMISDQTPWRDLEVNNLGWDIPLKSEAWLKKLQHASLMTDFQYNSWSNSALAEAEKLANDRSAIDSNKDLFLP